MTEYGLSRRHLVGGALVFATGGVAGYVVGALAGPTAADGTQGGTAANAYGPATGAGPRPLVALAQVPTGGGVVLSGDRLVVTRSAAGEVHAFSAVCTHQGCVVDRVARGTIDCPCHGSTFDADTGAVTTGPATRALAAVAVTVREGSVYRA